MKRANFSTAALSAALLFSLAAPSTLTAQDWAKARLDVSSRHHEYVSLKHGNRTLQAFVVYPEVKTKAPVVILIHEIFGLSDWAKEMADKLAAQGFIVVAPNYAGYDVSSLPYHPYLNGAQQSGDMMDALSAARTALPTTFASSTSDNGQLLVTGYSQGGYVALRTVQALQAAGQTVTAAAPARPRMPRVRLWCRPAAPYAAAHGP